jgi:hypothetical protein
MSAHAVNPEPKATPRPRLYGLLAEFDSPRAIYEAAKRVRAAGYRFWDCCTPFPVHGLDRVMGVKMTILPLLVFGAGATGCILGLLLQWFTNATDLPAWFIVPVRGYAFMISGKPFWSLPANIPVIFELTVLLSAVATVTLMLLLNGLPRLYHPLFKSKRFLRATDDRFFVVIEARDPKFYREKTERFLESLDPISIEAVED